jgi:ATPase subunit of ABC transporter with duplicated ATPase domains
MQSPPTSSTIILAGLITTKGLAHLSLIYSHLNLCRNFAQFYATKTERDRNLRKEYENQMEYRKGLQAFIDRWRYNANRGKGRNGTLFSLTQAFVSCSGANEDQNIRESE